MLTLFSLVVMSFILIVHYFRKSEGWSAKLGVVVGGLTITIMVFALLCTVIMAMSSHKQEYAEHEKVEIVALQNRSPNEGSFFLASGRIESVPYYFFYYKLPNGGKKLGKVLAENAEVYEEDRSDGYMAKIQRRTSYSSLREWTWLLVSEFMLRLDESYHSTSNYAIHVPKGTIKTGFNLDLKDLK